MASQSCRGGIDLRGKHAAITGASSGIGKEIALTSAKQGTMCANDQNMSTWSGDCHFICDCDPFFSVKMTNGQATQYHASKSGLDGFLGSIYEDVREYGIKVCSIIPGFVNTPTLHNRAYELDFDKCNQAEDIAQGVRYILKTPYSVCPTEIKYRCQYNPSLK